MFNPIIEKFFNECEEPTEPDEYGATVPTPYSLKQFLSIMSEIGVDDWHLTEGLVLSLSFLGGVRVQWGESPNSVRLILAANENDQTYLYFEKDEDYGIEDITVEGLVKRLKWLKEE